MDTFGSNVVPNSPVPRCGQRSRGLILQRLTAPNDQHHSKDEELRDQDSAANALKWRKPPVISQELSKPVKVLPTILEGTREWHGLSAVAAARTGLAQGLPVVLGYLDLACGALGAGAYGTGDEAGVSILGTADIAGLTRVVERDLGTNFSNTPGAGAAGGFGYEVLTFVKGQ
jgi:hypothetical protein